MDREPNFCSDCGGKLISSSTRKPTSSWHKFVECTKCKAEYEIVYGDVMGGTEYCYINRIPTVKSTTLRMTED